MQKWTIHAVTAQPPNNMLPTLTVHLTPWQLHADTARLSMTSSNLTAFCTRNMPTTFSSTYDWVKSVYRQRWVNTSPPFIIVSRWMELHLTPTSLTQLSSTRHWRLTQARGWDQVGPTERRRHSFKFPESWDHLQSTELCIWNTCCHSHPAAHPEPDHDRRSQVSCHCSTFSQGSTIETRCCSARLMWTFGNFSAFRTHLLVLSLVWSHVRPQHRSLPTSTDCRR